MSLDDFIKLANAAPDDVDDVRMFMQAICEKIPPHDMSRMLDGVFLFAINLADFVEEASTLRLNNAEQPLGILALIKLYQFLKKNENSIYALLNIGPVGETFLDSY